MRQLLAVPLAVFSLGAAEPAFHYRLDPQQSDVAARVSVFGLASKTAHFPRMSGAITLRPQRLDAIDLSVDLDARALTASDAATLSRLKGPDFFDVEHYPSVHFTGIRMTMTGPVTAKVDGAITARGVTRPAVLAVTFRDPPSRASGRDPVLLSARTTINRRDFGMTAYNFMVGRSVTITINARMVPGDSD